jgi:hypothetical protein
MPTVRAVSRHDLGERDVGHGRRERQAREEHGGHAERHAADLDAPDQKADRGHEEQRDERREVRHAPEDDLLVAPWL